MEDGAEVFAEYTCGRLKGKAAGIVKRIGRGALVLYASDARNYRYYEALARVANGFAEIPPLLDAPDGVIVSSRQKDGETYLISNSYELAWFRDEVNKGKYTLNARLTENINLGGHPWTAISKLTDTSAKTGYKGTFDGNGKTISGLNPVGELISGKYRGAGLFGYVYTGGTVKNVTVEGAS